jgi:hypothetical protein
MKLVDSKKFIGPDGQAYQEHKPEDGGFLIYFDGSTWLITFPISEELDQNYLFYGDRLPSSPQEWRMRLVGARTRSPFPAFIEN